MIVIVPIGGALGVTGLALELPSTLRPTRKRKAERIFAASASGQMTLGMFSEQRAHARKKLLDACATRAGWQREPS